MQAIPRLKLLFERPLGKPLATERCALTVTANRGHLTGSVRWNLGAVKARKSLSLRRGMKSEGERTNHPNPKITKQ